jgi:hypothetical protein
LIFVDSQPLRAVEVGIALILLLVTAMSVPRMPKTDAAADTPTLP